MKKLIATAAALAIAGTGLAACNDNKESKDEMMTSEMMAPSSGAMMSEEMSK
ncbi:MULTISPECIES: hypothetical protein [Corynebacterium]|uniref:Coproporphyrinogen III oxidase n=1 Tax=Corynebacterium striatum TaxID=43770 RepID=A0AAQ1TU87_CORST|nr:MULTISPECIES: hypothetical protein [Corynebacterium]EEI78077.1 hypothetical protein HMPREF0308_1597 [Corynebacterium striatum ATCC 6940]MDK8808826.1 hypothetical protein [Corynebacterium striatum]MDK8812532.1 hypothetical protein [Corynebacterium striatum]QQE52803.1 hypothetical protein I6I11_12080 [Corynebacterium striatum]QQU77766.1 hypothetical protein I6I72_04275 [Corynebacterium striatum]